MKDITKATPGGSEEPVIYLEADEEITAATSRMLATSSKEVRIVVPKRSTLLQSVVNQKLLKRAADNAGKILILVTADRTATHLAAQVGLMVAPSVKAAAAVPDASAAPEDDDSDIVEAAATAAVAASALKATPKPAYATPMMKSEPKINNPFAPEDEIEDDLAQPEPKKKSKKLKKSGNVPDFNKLPKRVLLAAGGVLAVMLLMFGQYYFKRATVTLVADGQLVDVNTTFKVDTNANTVSVTSSTIPAKKYEISRDLSGSAATTGTKDVGTKATGTMTILNHCYNPGTLATGTKFKSSSGLTFVSTESVVVPDGSITAGSCNAKTVSVAVTAAENGDQYNLAPNSYTSSGFPSSGAYYVKLTGSQMSGGTTKNIKVASQADIDKIKADAIDKDKDDAGKELRAKLSSSQLELTDSFTPTPTNIVATPAVDNEGDQVSVKFTVTYSLLAVKRDDLDTLITAILQKQVGSDKQIYQTGVDAAKITAKDGGSYGFVSTASAGKKIDTDALIQEIKGKRAGAATDIASKIPGVSKAIIVLSPSWSVKLPSILDHIKVDIKVDKQTKP